MNVEESSETSEPTESVNFISDSEATNLLTAMERSSETHINLVGFSPLLITTEILGFILFVLTFVWSVHFSGGFAWTSNVNLQFNWHPFLMIIGMVILYANSILIYRIFRDRRKRQLKLAHTILHLTVFVMVVIALKAVFDFHNLSSPPKPNLYSLHSWMGLTTVILFSCQFLAGFITFLVPGLQTNLRSLYLPIHVYFGLAGFIFSVATCLMGLNERAIFKLGGAYGDLPAEGLMVNFIGIILVLFAAFVVYLITKYEYRRVAKDEDGNLLTGRAE